MSCVDSVVAPVVIAVAVAGGGAVGSRSIGNDAAMSAVHCH